MKVLHIPFTFYPAEVGGTEIYVDALCRRLRSRRVDSVVAAPGPRDSSIEHFGTRVRRYFVPEAVDDVGELYGDGTPGVVNAFNQILDEELPQILHLHALTRGVSVRLIRSARQRQRHIRIIYTYHSATATCQRGTLLCWGREPCGGTMRERLCTGCTLQGLGMPRIAATALAGMPVAMGRALERLNYRGKAWTALRMRALVAKRQEAARAFLSEVDHIVVPCEWARQLLMRNGIPDEKISLSRQGLCSEIDASTPVKRIREPEDGMLRVAFLGRLNTTKGIDVLIRAVRGIADARIAVDIYGISQGAGDVAYQDTLRLLTAGDDRFRFMNALPAGRVLEVLRDYDVLAVPSQTLETGPMVILEAFASGVPVLGSALGGIAELVRHDVDGFLLPPSDVDAWSSTLFRLIDEPATLRRLRSQIIHPRTMDAVADEMVSLYARLLSSAGCDE